MSAHTAGPIDVAPMDHSSGGNGAMPSTLFRVSYVSHKDFTGRVADRCHDDAYINARLLKAAYESYDRHFGPRAVEAAEGDLLGKALEALRDAADEIRALREWIDTFPSKAIAPDDWAKLHKPLVTKNTLKNISTILSQAQAREVTR